MVAARAKRNYLVVALGADQLSRRDAIVDPESPTFTSATIPSDIGEVLDKYLKTLSVDESLQSRALLTALAYARGEGIDDRTWLEIAEALGYDCKLTDVDRLRDSTASDFLLRTVHTDSAPVTRLNGSKRGKSATSRNSMSSIRLGKPRPTPAQSRPRWPKR